MPSEDLLRRYAELVVRVGLNLGEGQDLHLACFVEQGPLVRAIAKAAYEAGARRVDVFYSDPLVQRETIEHAEDDDLDWTPPWLLTRLEYMNDRHAALLGLSGNPYPDAFAGLDGDRVEEGRIVDVRAARGADVVRGQLESDGGACRLGELALVDGHSRVGERDTVSFDVLFDENAAPHIAYGFALPDGLESGADGGNQAETHTDFMIGGAEVDVDGVDADGSELAILRGGEWVLG